MRAAISLLAAILVGGCNSSREQDHAACTLESLGTASRIDSITLLNAATQRETSVKLAEITDNKPLGSLLPAGLVDRLTREELRDLFRYLGGLGK